MGNVLEQETITTEDADTTEDDLKWLAVSAVAVDVYIVPYTAKKSYCCICPLTRRKRPLKKLSCNSSGAVRNSGGFILL